MESPEGGAIRRGGERRLRTCSVEPDPRWGKVKQFVNKFGEGYAQNDKEMKNIFPIFTE